MAIAILTSSPSRGETIKAMDTLRGTAMTAEKCAHLENAVWVIAYGQGICMRYYVSTAGGSGHQPVVFLGGDRGAFDVLHENVRHETMFSRALQNFSNWRKAKDVDTDDLMATARNFSRRTGTTAIVLARMGLDGSSGHHGLRRTMLELQVTSAALGAIKERHGYKGFHLFGQSGGSLLIGGMLALRRDIGCAVPGSGRLALLKEPMQVQSPALERYDPVKMIPTILQNESARIIVLTDPADRVVPSKNQNAFVERFREAGGRVEQFFVESTTKKHHGLTPYSTLVVNQCMRSASHAQIERKLARFVEKRLEEAEDD